MKLSWDGNIEWQLTWDDIILVSAVTAIQTMEGGYIIGGESSRGYRILKLTSDGKVEWLRILGFLGNTEPYSIVQTPDGGYILCGDCIVKLSAVGDIEWQYTYLNEGGSHAIFSIQSTFNGGYIAAGTFGLFDGELRVIKLGALGEVQWHNAYPVPSEDLGGFLTPSSINLQATPLNMTLLCSGVIKKQDEKKKFIIRR